MISQATDLEINPEPGDFARILRHRSLHQANQLAYTFLVDGESEEVCLTYGELHGRAQTIASHLQVAGCRGQRVLLLLPSGLDYLAAFFGCLYAGAIAVPGYPPKANRSLH